MHTPAQSKQTFNNQVLSFQRTVIPFSRLQKTSQNLIFDLIIDNDSTNSI